LRGLTSSARGGPEQSAPAHALRALLVAVGGPFRRHPLLRFTVLRLVQGILTLLAASIVIFIGTSVVPGSPATALLGHEANPKAVAAINRRLGYDKPIVQRYLTWLDDAVHGNLGNSAIDIAQGLEKSPVWSAIRSPLIDTIVLATVTMTLLIPLSMIMGLIAGITSGRWPDQLLSTLTLVFMALPEFVVGAILIAIFFVAFNLLPPVSLLAPDQFPLSAPKTLVMPVLTLLAVSLAWTVRLVRIGTIEVMKTDYVQMARLQGISERRVLRRYVLRNALGPSVQIFALSLQYLLGGVIVTETVFNYPGLGRQLVNAVSSHDDTEVQAIALILAAIYISINVLADLIVMILVPKLRTEA
jgi:peptide/nickel transport system permease protein